MALVAEKIFFPHPIKLPWSDIPIKEIDLKNDKANSIGLKGCNIKLAIGPDGQMVAISISHKNQSLIIPYSLYYYLATDSNIIDTINPSMRL